MADRRPRILIPITRARTAAALLEVAAALMRGENGSGILLGVVELPKGRPIADSVIVRSSSMSSGEPQLEQKLLSGGFRCPHWLQYV